MYYEPDHPIIPDYFRKESSDDSSFPAHMHYCYEVIIVTEGEMVVTVNDTEYTLCRGEAIVVFPNQIHSMHTPVSGRHILFIFAPNLISAYTKTVGDMVPTDQKMKISPLCAQMAKTIQKNANVIEIKGFLYTLFSEFHKNSVYMTNGTDSRSLLFRIFRFIQENYEKECTLHALSQSTGYDYSYLSRYFKRLVGISFNEYVNKVRVSHACYLLSNNNMSVFEISDECGFKSLRSLNRNFKEIVGITPTEYRKQQSTIAKE